MPAPTPVLRVALPVPLPRLFDYLPPIGLATDAIAVGQRLQVPFGSREACGIVIGHGHAEPGVELRQALALPDPQPLLRGELLASLQWLAGYLHAPLGEVLATALPAALRRGEPAADTTAYGWVLTEAGHTALPAMRNGKPKALATLLASVRAEDWLDDEVPGWRASLRSLRERGLVEREKAGSESPFPRKGDSDPAFSLNDEQRVAADAVRAADGFAAFLLDGVTGSGKTEVYLDAITDCLARGKQALVLVPEIGLTPQALARFRKRLGVPVHALHSGLNDNQRARVWLAAARGQARVIVGTRSAVFVPLPDAGLIVVDEEHDGSYKQFDGIRYHARDVAIVRARALGVPAVLGSATPSLESLHNAQAGRYVHLRLRHRAGNARPPHVRVLDVRKRPLHAGLGEDALLAIRGALDAGGQVLVFRNRRGYAPVLLCHDCGWSAHCPRCSTPDKPTPMTVHAHGRRLQCHHCGHRRPSPLACPDCASLGLQPQGNGTERIEAELQARFADMPVLRIDRGSTGHRDALQQHFDELGAQPGILVGTQMLAKGHDLPNLTLVVVVGIDEGLFSADFRSSEKLAQLLVQVAGRAGRADKPGTVLLQTHHPDHPLLQILVNGGYHAFAEGELELRQAAGFPPFAHLALLRAEARHADPPMQFLHVAKAAAKDFAIEASGPLPAPMPRRAGYQRAQLVLSAAQRRDLHVALEVVMPALYAAPDARKVRWSLDVDPVELY
ncbi:primosomal protein N' [Thermomonas carbonis]|uniref:Replication restart protein PriA n=1 Tax=Thermomonas carbonis TaxID=1463158 RepID=A0A7G9STE5_9GAMM|nr:primosomal protein N' [Thermomonas carbonis]QNN71120.1 primosomal protein N' [Thermomonas carbonis]GHC12377.1 primosomal protein N' [Thermomonas carbonis]